jgi:hypothetical protein
MNTKPRATFQQKNDYVQQTIDNEMDTITMGEVALEKAERLFSKKTSGEAE